jgi:hypothetical protein
MGSSLVAAGRPYGGRASAPPREGLLVGAWWIAVACIGVFITIFGHDFLPAKFSLDAAIIRQHLAAPDLWTGMSFDSFVNTARFWSVVFALVPQAVAIPAYYCLLAIAAVRLLDVFHAHGARYHLLAGGWIVCSALFLSHPNKEMIALPIALWLCLAGSTGTRFLATALFLLYTVFFRQYWAICYLYFACALLALRMHVAGRSGRAICLMLLAYAAPFALAQAIGFDPLTDARTMVNADRVDSPDARSAFDNTFGNTGWQTDVANAAIAWMYMNVPVALLARTSPHYVFFAAFQICTLWFFVAGCAAFLRAARRIRQAGSVYPRCAAFVIAYSLTQSIFEPDFGSFVRHEVIFMVPMLIVVFYRAHAYGRNTAAHV